MSDTVDLKVKLGIETSSATKQIKELTNELKTIDKEIKSLDINTNSFSKNMQNMGAKADLCKTKVSGLNDKLEAYKTKLKDADTRLTKAKDNLTSLGERTKENAKAWDDASKKVELAQTHYNNINRKLQETEVELKNANKELLEVNKTMAKMPFDNLSKGFGKISKGFSTISTMTKPLSTALGGIFTGAITTAISFEEKMAEVGAIVNASAEDLGRLSDKARDIGKNTKLSASDGAEALKLLAQAGYDVDDSISTVDSTVNLAIATNMELAESTGILTSILKAYNLEVGQSTRVTDILSKTASSSNTNVSQLGEAFKNIAPTASAMGYTVEDTALAVGLLANQAIVGSEAGNGLKSILASLIEPTKDAQEIMDKYGFTMIDANGNALPLIDVLRQLREKFGGLDETQQAQIATTLVGKLQMSKFLALINGGDEDFNNLANAIQNCDGTTEKMRKTMEETASGSVKELLSKLEEMAIQIGEKLLPHFVKIVEKIQSAVDWFNNLDESTQDLLINIGLLGVGLSPVSGLLGKAFGGASKLAEKLGDLASNSVEAGAEISQTTSMLGKMKATIGSGASGLVASLGGLVGVLGALGTGVAIAGAGMAIYGVIYGLQHLKDTSLSTMDTWSVVCKGMEDGTNEYVEKVSERLGEAEKVVKNFKKVGTESLIDAFKNAKDGVGVDLTGFKDTIKSQLEQTKTIVDTNTSEMINTLALFNDNATGTMVFTLDELAKISNSHSDKIFEGVQTAYDGLMQTVDEKGSLIEQYMQEYGMSYEEAYAKWEEQVLIGYQDFCEQMTIAQSGHQAESLQSLNDYLDKNGALNKDNWTTYLADLNQGLQDEKDIINQRRQEKLSALIEANNELAVNERYSMEEMVAIADLQAQQEQAIAVDNYNRQKQIALDLLLAQGEIRQDEYEQEFKAIAESKTLNDNYQKYLGELLERSATDRSGVWEQAYNAMSYIEKDYQNRSLINSENFLDNLITYFENGGTTIEGAIEYCTQQMSNDMETAEGNVTSSAENIQSELNDTASNAETNAGRINTAIQSIQGKTIDVDVVFRTEGYESLVRKMNHVSTSYGGKYGYDPALNDYILGINAYDISPYADFFGGMNAESYPTFDFYGLKDGATKTISLASFADEGISAYATNDDVASSLVSNSVNNYNNYNSQPKRSSYSSGQVLNMMKNMMNDMNKNSGVNINLNIERFENNTEKDIEQLCKEISYYLQIHNKRW